MDVTHYLYKAYWHFRYHHTVCLGLCFTKTRNSDKNLVAAETKVKLSKISIPRFRNSLQRSKEGWTINILNISMALMLGLIGTLIKLVFVVISGSIHSRFQQHWELHWFGKCLRLTAGFQKASWKLLKSLVKTKREVPAPSNVLLAILSSGIAIEHKQWCFWKMYCSQ